jgi:uncharacterized protein YlaI
MLGDCRNGMNVTIAFILRAYEQPKALDEDTSNQDRLSNTPIAHHACVNSF